MEVLQSLGLDYTIAYQILVFLVAYVFLSNFLFKPYLNAYEKRQEKTIGQENLAEEIDLKTQDLHLEYDKLQKDLNKNIQAKFNAAKSEANQEANQIMDNARSEAENFMSQANQRLNQDIEKTRASFKDEIPSISQVLAEKLVGRNI